MQISRINMGIDRDMQKGVLDWVYGNREPVFYNKRIVKNCVGGIKLNLVSANTAHEDPNMDAIANYLNDLLNKYIYTEDIVNRFKKLEYEFESPNLYKRINCIIKELVDKYAPYGGIDAYINILLRKLSVELHLLYTSKLIVDENMQVYQLKDVKCEERVIEL